MRRYHKNSNGFTMAEMLITVAIIVILCGFGFVAVIAHQRNLKRMEMDETAQEIFIAAQNHLTAARASGQWSSFLEKTAAEGQKGSRGTSMSYDPSDYNRASDADAESRKFYYFTTESAEAVKNGAEALILPEGSIDETLRGHHFYVEYDAASGTVFGVFYTDSDHPITADDATAVSLSRTDPDARRDYKVDGKRTIIGYYGGALGELNSPGDLYAPSVAVRNAESLVLYVVDKNYYRPVSSKTGAQNFKTKLKLTFEGVTSGEKTVKEVDPLSPSSQTDAFSSTVLAEESEGTFNVVIPSSGASAQQTTAVKAEYYAIVLDSIVRKDGHFADLFPEFIPGEDIRITATLTSDKAGEDVSQTVTVNSLFNSVKTEKNLSGIASKTVVTVSNPRHLENLSSEVSGVDFAAAGKQIVKDTTVDTVSVVRNLFWDEDAEAEKGEVANEKVTAFIPAIASATGMKSEYGYNAGGAKDAAAITKENLQVYPYSASGTENAANSFGNSAPTSAGEGENLITKGSCYGITNTAIKSFEGNNHILAAFRFEGKQKAALINEAADGLTVSDLLIADVSSVVTGEKADGTGSEESPAAAILLAKAKGGSIENIAVRWYEGGTNQNVTLPAGRNVTAGMQGCRVYAEKGIASALIGSVDAKQAGSTAGSLEISNVSIRTVVKAASADGKKVTAHLGIEGETTAVLLGEIKSGAVTLDNSKQTEEDRKSYVCIEGTLSLKSDKGQEDSQASGGLIGRISGGESALVKQLDFTASRMEMETKGGAAGGLAGVISGGQKAGLEEISLSANSLDVTGKTAAGGAVGNVSAGELSLNKINILTTKENKQDCGEAGQETNGTEKLYGIRVTAENGTAGGLLGTASSSVTELTITKDAVSGSGTADQVKAGSSAGGLIGDTKASNTTITSSAASLYIRSEGNGGNVGGSSSTDGAGGLIGSASGNVTITYSYSGGRTKNADDPEKNAGDASAMQARYVNAEEGQGRYNVYLASGSGAAGGLLGRFDGTGSLKIENSYSTSSVAVRYSAGSTGAAAGGLVGDAGAATLTANNTYCTGRVYANGAQNGTSIGTATGAASGSSTGGTSGSTAGTSTPNYGTYAGKLGGINGSGNYYLKGMNEIPSDAVGTLGGKNSDITIAENVLTGADYYDDNCALKKGVDTAQKSYYFDTALATTKYPFKTVTTAIARPVCDPDTGIRNQNAEDDTNRFAQIGDWEIPKKEASAEGAYGLIYYEKIYDPTTGKNEPTFYYHGFIRTSGSSADDAVYTEIKQNNLPDNHSYNANGFVTDREVYVAEDGYLLLVGKEVDVNKLILSFGETTKNINEIKWDGVSIKLSTLTNQKYPLQNENVEELKNYNAYVVNKKENNWNNQQYFRAYNKEKYGAAIVIWEQTKDQWGHNIDYGKTGAAFTYLPFFADTISKADYGKLNDVGTSEKDGTLFAIRSARQLRDFIESENVKTWNSYLAGGNNCIIELQLDITLNHEKVRFTDKAKVKPENSVYYTIPTLSEVHDGMFRSHLRPNPEDDQDFYVLDGLRGSFVTTVIGGEICKLRLNDMSAPFFAFDVKDNAIIENVTIQNSLFASGTAYDQTTTAAFASQMSMGAQASVRNCTIKNSQIRGNGFVGTASYGILEKCTVENCTIEGNGFAGKLEWNVTKVSSCVVKDSSIAKNGFAEEIHTGEGSIEDCGVHHSQIVKNGFAEKIDQAKNISNCELIDNRIGENGFAETLVAEPNVQNCKILNAMIGKNGFATTSTAKIKNCKIVNARIGKNGFLEKNGGVITATAVYADKNEYSKEKNNPYYTEYFTPYSSGADGYQYLVIGVASDGTISNTNLAGFVLGDIGWHSVISDCFVAGTIYGQDVAGFIGNVGDSNQSSVKASYANVIIHATGKATGFAFTAGTQTEISGCHTLGRIDAKSDACGLLETAGDQAQIIGNYSAIWSVSAREWHPFYKSISTTDGKGTQCSQNYYLCDCEIKVSNSNLIDYGQNVKGLSYEQLCNQAIEGLQKGTQAGTKGYYRYMHDDNDHKIYPYPMPAGMIAYGDWSYEDPDRYALLYYEKVNGEYYFHGYATEDGENYEVVETSGNNLENGLLAETNKTVMEDGYILITGANGSWSAFGRSDNSGNVSSPINNANTSIFKDVSSDTDLLNALKDLKKKDTDKIYAFQLDKYLAYEDTTKNFASWQTLTKESGGIGISIYSTKGMTPMAKFSFQSFFADTVKGAQVSSNGSTADKKISFVVTTDGDEDHDYRIRSLRQLQALSDWDAGIWKNTTVADSSKLEESFDKDNAKRYSYLSTLNENYTNGLKIRQDMDINVDGANVNFDRLDGIYAGRQYSDRSVMLQKLEYDFADTVVSGGEVSSLVIDHASLQGTASTAEKNGDVAHGGQREFVEYNYGTISNITVQNSELGSAGLVYQNGDDAQKVLIKNGGTIWERTGWTRWDSEKSKNICQYATTITYTQGKTGPASVKNCTVQNSSIIDGVGLVWRNQGTRMTVPERMKQYQYWYDRWEWTTTGTEQVSDSTIAKNNLPVEESSSEKIMVAVDAIIENCQVVNCSVKEMGAVWENTVKISGSVESSADNNSGAKAKISNCQVHGTSSYSDMKIGSSSGAADVNEVAGFAGNNGKGAEIENCSVTGQVGGLKNVAGFALTNAGTITGSYANTKITCEGNQETMLSGFVLTNTGTIDRSHSLGEESCNQTGSGADNRAAGFVVNNQKATDSSTNAVIRNSYAAMWKLELNGMNYVPFGSKDSTSGAGSYENCYAMKLSADDGYSGTYLAASASGITYVFGEDLEKKCGDILGNAAEDGKTTAYQAELKSTNYPFPCGSTIMNYGDWKLTDGNSAATHTITLAAGSKAVFSEDLVKSLSKNAAVMTASDDGSMESADGVAITGTENAYGQDTIPEEDRHEVQLELGEEEETLDLAELVPVRKGWKLLGWLITSPSELSASETTTTVSDVVTKINKLSDGEAEASGSSKAVYELETGTKSYHYAPDAVITVTEDMTLSAVWVPDDDTVEKAKDGKLRMDVNGAILDGEEQVTNDVTNETTETDSDASAADTSSAVTSDDTDGMTSENQDASTDQTADASGTLPAQNTEDDMSEMSDLTAESDPEMETSPETTGEEGDPAGEQ